MNIINSTTETIYNHLWYTTVAVVVACLALLLSLSRVVYVEEDER